MVLLCEVKCVGITSWLDPALAAVLLRLLERFAQFWVVVAAVFVKWEEVYIGQHHGLNHT